ncbi:hypothetical protein [Lysinibacillus sp. NPDC056232]
MAYVIAFGGFRPTDVFCAKAKRQRQMSFVQKRSANAAAEVESSTK